MENISWNVNSYSAVTELPSFIETEGPLLASDQPALGTILRHMNLVNHFKHSFPKFLSSTNINVHKNKFHI
jgi:hypothetical protein